MLKGAIFDFDGTLFDSMFVWENAGEVYLRSLGIEPQEKLAAKINTMSLQQSAEYIRGKYAVDFTVNEIIEGINRTVEQFYFNTVQPKPGVIAFLEQLKAGGVKMCIATASARYQIKAALKRCGMEAYFSEIFTCDDIGHGKDEPFIFRKALEHLNTSRSDTVVFEDSYYAVKTAKADGFIIAAVYDFYEKSQEELRALADFFIEDYRNTDTLLKSVCGI